MPALNFQKQFARDVRECRKRQTIRADRKTPIKPGDTLYLYTGMRTKKCVKLAVVECKSVERIMMGVAGMFVDGKWYGKKRQAELAKADGFETYSEMVEWFEKTHGLPFTGILIKWEG